jgi:hypothetical protein
MSDTEVLPAVAEPPDNADLPGALAAAAPRRWSNRATPVLLAVFLLAGGFLGGVQAEQNWGRNPPVREAPRVLPTGAGGNGEATTGTLKSVTANAVTLQTEDGRTVTVRIIEGTKIQQATTLARLSTGRPVAVQGSTATDGSITATAVTVS